MTGSKLQRILNQLLIKIIPKCTATKIKFHIWFTLSFQIYGVI